MKKTTIGIIGCGNISDAYLKGAARSDLVAVKTVADINAETAATKAATYGIQARSVDQLLADDDIEIVINITVPLAHADVSKAIISAGKHVYSEKPLAATLEDGRAIVAAADAKGVRLGCAPDTFLGAAHQACREAIDQGRIGDIVGGAATFMNHGMEHWHPNPTFFYQPGGGPVLDMAPYYLTTLINLIGPIKRVTAMTATAFQNRTVISEGPMTGRVVDVQVPTTMHGLLAFENGATVTISTSWDVWKHGRAPIEVYGELGSMLVPDPNFFDGAPKTCVEREDWTKLDIDHFPFGVPNRPTKEGGMVADYRIIGLLDMAVAKQTGRPHRANGVMALHVLEVMEALGRSADENRHIDIESRTERPAALPEGDGETVFL